MTSSSDEQRTPWQQAFAGSPLALNNISTNSSTGNGNMNINSTTSANSLSPPLLTSQSGHRYADYNAPKMSPAYASGTFTGSTPPPSSHSPHNNLYQQQQQQQQATRSPSFDYVNPQHQQPHSGASPFMHTHSQSAQASPYHPSHSPHLQQQQQQLLQQHHHQYSSLPNSPFKDSYAYQPTVQPALMSASGSNSNSSRQSPSLSSGGQVQGQGQGQVQNQSRPPISVLTSQPSTPSYTTAPVQNQSQNQYQPQQQQHGSLLQHGNNDPSATLAMPMPMSIPGMGTGSMDFGLGGGSSAFNYLATGGLDPTSMIYDENSGGYATPSYAGSYADDSSFDDRRSHSPFSSQPPSKSHSPNPQALQQQLLIQQQQQPQQQQQQTQQGSTSGSGNGGGPDDTFRRASFSTQEPPFASNANELLAFRDSIHQNKHEWDDLSSNGGLEKENSIRSSPSIGGQYGSPDLGALQQPSGQSGLEGHGLEMAVERMFAPLPSPKLLPFKDERADTLRSTSAPPGSAGHQLSAQQQHPPGSGKSVLTSSPAQSPSLRPQGGQTQAIPPVPSFLRLSPSPTAHGDQLARQQQQQQSHPQYQQTLESVPEGQPSLKSPPLPNAIQQSSSTENRNASLAPLAIPSAPDLTLTTATPTAIPRTATARQDSTQAALDTVFSTFFQRNQNNNRQDSKDSTDSGPTNNLHAEAAQALFNNIPAHDLTLDLEGGRNLGRPIRQRSKSDTYMTSPVTFGGPSFSFSGPDSAVPQQPSAAIDPRELDGRTPGWENFKAMAVANQQGSALSMGDNLDDLLGTGKPSEAGPSARRRSVVDSGPYDPFSLNFPSPDSQSFLVPPSPGGLRRSRSHGSHRRGAQSEDYTASTFTPRSAQFPELRTPNIQMTLDQHSQQQLSQHHHSPLPQHQLPAMPPSDPALSQMSQYLTQGYEQPGYDNGQYDFSGLPPMPSAYGQRQESSYGIPPSSGIEYGHNQQAMQPGYQGYMPPPSDPYMLPGGNTLLPNYPSYTSAPGMAFGMNDFNYPGSNMMYQPLEEDFSTGPDGFLDPGRMRRRSSVRSDTSGVSGLSGASDFTLESKTTEATKQAARRRRKDPAAAKFQCEYCGETFTRAYNLKGHIRSHEGSKPFVCISCGKGFARRHDLKRHELLHSGVKKYMCEACQTPFVRLDALQRHHKSENGAACIQQIAELSADRGVEL